ncbi:hypothetical protein E1258_31160 [Micromonospora sp. KC207]|nr:hypothetical protein E1258_31160 [Micromonospora sp. KC207]
MAEHMDPEEFHRAGHAVVDWIADYWATLGQRPVTDAGGHPRRAAPGQRGSPARGGHRPPLTGVWRSARR